MFQLLGLLAVGLVIGALARLIKPGRQALSVPATLLLGVVGALIGGVIAAVLGTGSIFELNVVGFVLAVLAAIALVGTAERLSGRTGGTRGRLTSTN